MAAGLRDVAADLPAVRRPDPLTTLRLADALERFFKEGGEMHDLVVVVRSVRQGSGL